MWPVLLAAKKDVEETQIFISNNKHAVSCPPRAPYKDITEVSL